MFVGVVTDKSFHEAIAIMETSLQAKVDYIRKSSLKYEIKDYLCPKVMRYQEKRIYLDEYR